MGSAGVLVALVAIFMALGGMGAIVKLVEGRRKFLLELKREEARIAQAKAKELEIEQRRAELEYREALLELERFDRRNGSPGRPLPPELYPPDAVPPASPPQPDPPRPEPPEHPPQE